MPKSKGLLVVISGPSGAGKGTVYNAVLEKMPEIKKSISVTTRAPRKHEVDGVNYYFKTVDEYQQMIAKGEFLETAEVYLNYYGTPKAPVYKMLDNGDDVLFEVDIIGAKQIRKKYPDCVLIYLMTPSMADLEKRLRTRNTDSEDAILRRLSSAKSELAEHLCFDYIVFNDVVSEACDDVITIIKSEKLKIMRNLDKIKQVINNK